MFTGMNIIVKVCIIISLVCLAFLVSVLITLFASLIKMDIEDRKERKRIDELFKDCH